MAFDCAFGGEQTYMAVACKFADNLGCRPDDAKHAARRIPLCEVVLLYASQSLGRSGVAPQDNQLATHIEEFLHGLARKLVHYLVRARSVRRAGVVAEVEIIILWQQLANAVQNGKSAVSAVEDAYRALSDGLQCVRRETTGGVSSNRMLGKLKILIHKTRLQTDVMKRQRGV